jgi:hypothetical protein
LSKAVKHHWYGDTSPWTEQRHKDAYGFRGARSRPAEEVVILDQENPPQPPSVRTIESEALWAGPSAKRHSREFNAARVRK